MSAAIGLLELDILIPGSGSLKDKRKVIRSMKDKLRGRYNVSIAEVGCQKLHQRSHLALVTISTDRKDAQERLSAVLELVESQSGVHVIEHKIQWL